MYVSIPQLKKFDLKLNISISPSVSFSLRFGKSALLNIDNKLQSVSKRDRTKSTATLPLFICELRIN